MSKKRRQHEEEAWKNAKSACRLNARQVEMARALGMNPRKLPGLRASPQQRWKLPVGLFIEECYRKRFGERAKDRERENPSPRPLPGNSDTHTGEAACEPTLQAEELVCFLMNLAGDLRQWLAQGNVAEMLPEVSAELHSVATARDSGAWLSAIPEIPLPPGRARGASLQGGPHERPWDDEDDIRF